MDEDVDVDVDVDADVEVDVEEAEELHMSADDSLWRNAELLPDIVDKDKDKDNDAPSGTIPSSATSSPVVAAPASDRFTPKYVVHDDDDDDISHHPGEEPVDETSMGQTVASSTYGEDRQKVVNKALLDPYGDKGVYTGVILRSTGMPHGLGRMIYDEDGRIYEGDWYGTIFTLGTLHDSTFHATP
jgi:hypothetical protein